MFLVVSSGRDGAYLVCVCACACEPDCMCVRLHVSLHVRGARLPSVTGSGGRGDVCARSPTTVPARCSLIHNVCVLPFITARVRVRVHVSVHVCVLLSDRSAPEATAAAKYRTPGCTACAACRLRPHFHTNNTPQITRLFHLDEPPPERPHGTRGIRDDFILPQRRFNTAGAAKAGGGGKREKRGRLKINSQIYV